MSITSKFLDETTIHDVTKITCFHVCWNFIGSVHTPLNLTEAEWNDIMRTNQTGTWLVSKYVCMRMRDAKKGGSVINISSIVGLNIGNVPRGLAYAASKTAVNAITQVCLQNKLDIVLG